MGYTPSEIVELLIILGECNRNYREAAREYARRFPIRRHPDHKQIRILKLRAERGFLTKTRRKRVFNDDEDDVNVVLANVVDNPHTSCRIISRETGISKSTVNRILQGVKFHPYHITLVQSLTPQDYATRLEFCNWAVTQINVDNNFFNYVMFSDEATFKNDGQLNRHNCHYYFDENPRWFREVDHQHKWSVMVWCGIINGYLVGPYFFDENVNRHSFLRLLDTHLDNMLENVDLETVRQMWLQLDGAPPHFALVVRNYLNQQYPNRWVGRGSVVPWPPRSPDLTPPDFFLWGHLKNRVFATAPTTRENMIERIRNECDALPRNVLLSTIQTFKKRINLCIQQRGEQFEHLM